MLKVTTVLLSLLAGSAAWAQAAPPAPAPAAPPPSGAAQPTGATPAPGEVEEMPETAACTFTSAFRCEAGKSCEKVASLGEVKLPARFLVDFGKRVIAASNAEGLPHLSIIQSFAGAGDSLTLQGVDGPVGWVMQMSRSQEGVSLTTVSHEVALTGFGTCKPVP